MIAVKQKQNKKVYSKDVSKNGIGEVEGEGEEYNGVDCKTSIPLNR